MKEQVGVSLIELLIALLLSAFLYASCLRVYSTAQHQVLLQSRMHQLQQNATMVWQIFQNNIALAGYMGCPKLTADFPIQNRTVYTMTAQNKLVGFKRQGQDALTIRHMSLITNMLEQPMQSRTMLSISAQPIVKAGDVLVIADCQTAETVMVQHVIANGQHGQTLVTSQALSKLYEANALVGQLEMTTYFVAKTQRNYADNTPIYALYEETISHARNKRTELIEGVDDLQIHYGILQNDKLIEVTAADVTDWSLVKSVAMRISLSSEGRLPRQMRYFYITV